MDAVLINYYRDFYQIMIFCFMLAHFIKKTSHSAWSIFNQLWIQLIMEYMYSYIYEYINICIYKNTNIQMLILI